MLCKSIEGKEFTSILSAKLLDEDNEDFFLRDIAKELGVVMLSYSPFPIAEGNWQTEIKVKGEKKQSLYLEIDLQKFVRRSYSMKAKVTRVYNLSSDGKVIEPELEPVQGL